MGKNIFILLAVIFFLFSFGCLSGTKTLKETGYCAKVKDTISDNFGIYGLFLQEEVDTSSKGIHYCEYLLGKTKVLQLLYSEEPDPERAYFESLNGLKTNVQSNFSILNSKENEKKGVRSFYLELIGKKNSAITVHAAAFGDSSSVLLSATYVPGHPNPFTNGPLLEKISIQSLELSKKQIK